MANTRLVIIMTTAAVLLSIPLIAMQFTTEVDWTISDFIIAGILLFGTGLLCELVMRKVKTMTGRLVACGAVLFACILVWVELAVGIFGSPFAGS